MTDATAPADHADIAGMSFESALEELGRIVRELESGQVPLDGAIALYERGAALKAHCAAKLKSAEEKVDTRFNWYEVFVYSFSDSDGDGISCEPKRR